VVHGGLADDDVADAGFHLDARGRVLWLMRAMRMSPHVFRPFQRALQC